MNILLWNGCTHLMNNMRELPEIQLQSYIGCARTLHSNMSNKWSIGFKSKLCEGCLSFCALFATIITSVLLPACHNAWSRVNNSYRDWYGYEVLHFYASSQLYNYMFL